MDAKPITLYEWIIERFTIAGRAEFVEQLAPTFEQRKLVMPVDEALKQMRISSQSGIAGQVLQSGQAMIVNDVSRSAAFDHDIYATTGF